MTIKKIQTYAPQLLTALQGVLKESGSLRSPAYTYARQVLGKVRGHEKCDGPPRAFCCHIEGIAALYVPATNASQARWVVVKEQRDAGYADKGLFSYCKVSRAPLYDQWALTAVKKSHTQDDMPRESV